MNINNVNISNLVPIVNESVFYLNIDLDAGALVLVLYSANGSLYLLN